MELHCAFFAAPLCDSLPRGNRDPGDLLRSPRSARPATLNLFECGSKVGSTKFDVRATLDLILDSEPRAEPGGRVVLLRPDCSSRGSAWTVRITLSGPTDENRVEARAGLPERGAERNEASERATPTMLFSASSRARVGSPRATRRRRNTALRFSSCHPSNRSPVSLPVAEEGTPWTMDSCFEIRTRVGSRHSTRFR